MTGQRLKCFILAAIGWWLVWQPLPLSAQSPDKEHLKARLRELRQERISILKRAEESLELTYREGRAEIGRVLSAQLQLWDALLDAAGSAEERTKHLNAQYTVLKGVLDVAQHKFEAGIVRETDVLHARAACLLGEIRLLQAQSRSDVAVPDKAALPARVQSLQQDRIKTLQRAVEVDRVQAERGARGMGEVTASQATLTDALLEATPSKAVRIEILDRQCAALQAWHDLIQNRFEAGSARAIDAVTSKAAYLRVQLRRLLEQSAPDGPDGTPDGKALRARIQSVRQDRIATLQQAAEILELYYRAGRIDVDPVWTTQVALIDAQLEDAGSKAERMELLRARCAALKALLEIAQARLAGGMVAENDVLLLRAAWLVAEIRLLQEQIE